MGANSSQLRSMLRYQLRPPRKAGAGELRDVEIQVGLAEPKRERGRVGPAREPATAPRHHEAKPGRITTLMARRIAGTPIQSSADGRTYIPLEFSFGHPGGLEISLIEDRIVGLWHDRRRTGFAPRPIGHA